MKEAVFILLIAAILFALTAIRFRKHISTAIGIYREFGRMRSDLAANRGVSIKNEAPGALVCCQKCRKWVPELGAIRFGKAVFYCSQTCMSSAAVPNRAV